MGVLLVVVWAPFPSSVTTVDRATIPAASAASFPPFLVRGEERTAANHSRFHARPWRIPPLQHLPFASLVFGHRISMGPSLFLPTRVPRQAFYLFADARLIFFRQLQPYQARRKEGCPSPGRHVLQFGRAILRQHRRLVHL